MSKASDWAKQASEPPLTTIGEFCFEVVERGNLRVEISQSWDGDADLILTPKQVLQLRDWLTETFDEPAAEKGE